MNKFIWAGLFVGLLSACGGSDDPVDVETGEESWGPSVDGKADIYGTDDRKELNDPSVAPVFREVAESTAVIFSTRTVGTITDTTLRLSSQTMSAKQLRSKGAPLCTTERFHDEPAPGYCTGFLIAPDLVATAGHCVNGHTQCGQMGFAFDFAKETPSDDGLTINRDDFYRCEAVVGHVYDALEGGLSQLSTGELWYDWAVVKLNRPVTDRAPLPVKYGQGPSVGDKVTAVGHPSGLAMKVTRGTVHDASKTRFFNTDLDIYQGNSGSPVFDDDGDVRGIVVRGTGGNSFERTADGCYVSKTCDIYGDPKCSGNQVLRPEPLEPFQASDLDLHINYHTIEGDVSPTFEDSITIDEGGNIAFVTVNMNGFSVDASKLKFELTNAAGETVTLMERPKRLTKGYARWTRTTFDFNGKDARGAWKLRITDLDGSASARVNWWQVIVGVASNTTRPTTGPSTTPRVWIGDACNADSDCTFTESGDTGVCYTETGGEGFCTIPCEGYCPDRTGYATTFCIASDTPQTGICALGPDASNGYCSDIPGTTSQTRDRFIGNSTARASSRDVCAP